MRNALTFMKYSPLALCAVFLVGVGFKFKFNTDDKKSFKKKKKLSHGIVKSLKGFPCHGTAGRF